MVCTTMTTTPTVLMACDDEKQGFIAAYTDVTGYLKCPKDYPIVDKSNTCTTDMCFVDPDRYRCCRTTQCHCPNGRETVAQQLGGKFGTLCEKDGNLDCASCDAGYHLNAPAGLGQQSCLKDYCECDDGQAAINFGKYDIRCA